MSNNADFAENLVKGKIAETIFALMFRESANFTVLEFGYEKVIPQLIGFNQYEKDETVEIIRTAPDFAIISHGVTKQVRLVEVKYRAHLNYSEILQTAERMHKSWNPSYLFIASKDGFYFDEITNIINKDGNISPLHESQISTSLQEKYLQLVKEFEPDDFNKVVVAKSKTIVAK